MKSMVKQEDGSQQGQGVMIVSAPSQNPGGPQLPPATTTPKDDVDVVEECEIFDTRSEFLDFCKVRHFLAISKSCLRGLDLLHRQLER
jgi:hypothetical protein